MEPKFSKVESGVQSLKSELVTQLLKSVKNKILSNYHSSTPTLKVYYFKIEVLAN